MPRNVIPLRAFNVGLYSKLDKEDVPHEAQTEGSQNLDVETEGVLRGIPQHTSGISGGSTGTMFAWIQKTSSQWDLIYTNGTNIYMVSNFYNDFPAPTSTLLISGKAATSMVVKNKEVHIGCGYNVDPQWVGYISWGQWGESAPGTIVTENAVLTPPTFGQAATNIFYVPSDGITTTTGVERHEPGNEYRYRISVIYDGYQESELSRASRNYTVPDTPANIEKLTLKLSHISTVGMSKRITGVNIYRSSRKYKTKQYFSGDELVTEVINETQWDQYKLVSSIDIVDADQWDLSTGTYFIEVEDENILGVTYEQNSGVEETSSATARYGTLIPNDYELNYDIYTSRMKYTISTDLNGYLFAANGRHPELPEVDSRATLFRSKLGRYDVFDWVNDRLVLPTIPLAMAGHRGKLYVWDANDTYVIDPENMLILEKIKGRGCSSMRSLVNTDYGLFWANENGVYWSTLTEDLLQPVKDNLAEPIKDKYQAAADGKTPILTYNSPRNQLLVHLGDDVYAYNTVEKRWDYYPSFKPDGTVTGAFIGKDGATYTVTDTRCAQDFGLTSRKAWTFVSKEFIPGDASQNKKWYKLVPRYTGTMVMEYSVDGGDFVQSSGTLDPEIAKKLQIRLTGASNAVVDSVDIIFRELRGKR